MYVWHILFPEREREYARERREKGERADIYNTIIMEQETDGRWQSFLISRVHDKLLLMSDEEKEEAEEEAIFVECTCVNNREKCAFF
jgi:hypothetical protein